MIVAIQSISMLYGRRLVAHALGSLRRGAFGSLYLACALY